jgi:hypothetical protein
MATTAFGASPYLSVLCCAVTLINLKYFTPIPDLLVNKRESGIFTPLLFLYNNVRGSKSLFN